ncbi:hypothetical protein, partial [Rhizobium leguminosarum]|uniref:hypothetical protein n=1 Tax=Rhizobium leguminosarum TaxID=384 RepID=UPI003F9D6334
CDALHSRGSWRPAPGGRASHEDLKSLFKGYGYEPFFVEGQEPRDMHQQMAATFDRVFDRIREIQEEARNGKAPDT